MYTPHVDSPNSENAAATIVNVNAGIWPVTEQV
jgi:hypothetical protein